MVEIYRVAAQLADYQGGVSFMELGRQNPSRTAEYIVNNRVDL
jgi:hypothetical protein